jgi:HD-like signal output (HDOD) protein
MTQQFGTPTAFTDGRNGTGPTEAPAHDPALAHADAIVDAASRLRPLSHSTSQLIQLNSQPDVAIGDLVAVVSLDQVLAASVLREANSAAAATADPISTVDRAFMRLGTSRVMALALRLSLSGEMAEPVPQYRLADGALGTLSVAGSVAAELVRERAQVKPPAEVATAALLRDIGVLVLAEFLDPAHLLLLDVVREHGTALSDGERMVLDATHGEAGGLLCQQWKLPESVRLGVQYHHAPWECDEPIAHGVFLADTIAHHVALRTGNGWSHSSPDPEAVAASADVLRVDLGEMDALVDATIERFATRNTGLTL